MSDKTALSFCFSVGQLENFLQGYHKNPPSLIPKIGIFGGRKYQALIQGEKHLFSLNHFLEQAKLLLQQELENSFTTPSNKDLLQSKWLSLHQITNDLRFLHAQGEQLLSKKNIFIRWLTYFRRAFGRKFHLDELYHLEEKAKKHLAFFPEKGKISCSAPEPAPSADLKGSVLDARVVSVQREALLLGEEIIPADQKPLDCLILDGLDERFFGITIVDRTHPEAMGIIIKKEGVEKKIYVPIAEFAKRLNLNSHTISALQISQDESLNTYIKKQGTLFILSNYQRILEKQKREKKGAHWLKIIQEAFKRQAAGCPLYPLRFEGPQNIAGGCRKGKLHLFQVDLNKKFAEGGESEIYEVDEISSNKKKALKLTSSKNAQHEADILHQLHEGFKDDQGNPSYVPGIQKPFHAVLELENKYGIFQKRYSGNLWEALQIEGRKRPFNNLKEKLLAFSPLLKGLCYAITQKGFIHGDLKPHNILFSQDKEGKVHLFLSDFGTSAFYKKDTPKTPQGSKAFTPRYIYHQERAVLEKLRNELENGNGASWEMYIDNCKKLDIFALGCIIATLIDPNKNFFSYEKISGEKYPEAGSFNSAALRAKNIPKTLCSLVEEMVQVDPQKRPDIQSVYDRFQNIISLCP